MRTFCRKVVCLIVAAWLTISGTCPEEVKSDAAILYACNQNAASVERAEIDLLNCPAICASGNQSNQSIKREAKASLQYLGSDSFLLEEKLFFVSLMTDENQIICTDKLVVNYIHKTDGKKRI